MGFGRSLGLGSALLVAAVAGACGDDAGSSGGGAATSSTSSSGGPASSSSTGSSSSSSASTGGGGSGGGSCDPSLPVIDNPPETLSETGLYADIATDTVAAYAKPFQPKYPLWSDGAEKARWVYLPECSQVDTSDMDAWEMPIGARLWKQFTRDGVRVETRLILRNADGEYRFAAYQWRLDGSEADRIVDPEDDGVPNANGTDHDIPAESLCSTCHRNSWRTLGFSAVQLTHDMAGSETMASLSAAGLLTVPLPDGVPVPGNDPEQAALGYLHANCASCHNPQGLPSPSMHMKILQGDVDVTMTDTYLTTVDVPATMFPCGCDRIEPGDPMASAVAQRMGVRGAGQMPPIATEDVDAAGVAAVTAWIQSLP